MKEHPGYKALLITTWHSKQRPVLNSHTLALQLRSPNYTRLCPAWERIRKSSFAEWPSAVVVVSDCAPPLLKGPLLAKAIGKVREEKHIRPFQSGDTASEQLLSHR